MPTMLVYDRIKSEIKIISDRVATTHIEKDDINLFNAETLNEVAELVENSTEISICCADFNQDGESAIKIVKKQYPETLTIVIADSTTNPALYVKPSLMVAGLLLRPLSDEQVEIVLSEIIEMIWKKNKEQIFNNEVFVFTTREGTIRIPYSQILYFEARNKKIIACTERTETDFYSSLEKLSSELPNYFLRCHKGFIINKLLVERIDIGNNLLHLIGGFQVPISRSYKSEVKEALK